MGGVGKVFAVVLLILIAGLGIYFYQLYTAAKEVEITRISIVSFEVKGFPTPSKILMELELYVRNPTNTYIELEKLSYIIYINGKYAGEGLREYILIPANSETPIKILAETTLSDILKLIATLIQEGKRSIVIEVKGMMHIPIKLFGTIKTITVSQPFEISETYTLLL